MFGSLEAKAGICTSQNDCFACEVTSWQERLLEYLATEHLHHISGGNYGDFYGGIFFDSS